MDWFSRTVLIALCLSLLCNDVMVSSLSEVPQSAKNMFSQASERPAATHNHDPYDSIPPSYKHYWGVDTGRTVNETIGSFLKHQLPITINVRLAGFMGDGNQQVIMSELELLSYVRMISSDLHSVVLESGRHMVVQPELNFQLTRASPALSSDISTAVRRAAQDSTGGGLWQGLSVVPHTVTDDLIRKEFTATAATTAYFTLYILNPVMPSTGYVYSYITRAPNSYGAACHGQLWASADMPYAWIDLSAGPVTYGPRRGSDGQVLAHSVPRVEQYKKTMVKAAMPPDLAAIVLTAARHLVWPPLALKPMPATDEVDVILVRMHSALLPPTTGEVVPAQRLADSLGALRQIQIVTVKEHTIGFASCPLCAAAYSRALRFRYVRHAESMGYVSTQAYLDSDELHAALAEHGDAILANVGVRSDDIRSKGHRRVLPVFVYELSTIEGVTLDQSAQTAAFPDMAIGVWTSGLSGGMSEFYCGKEPAMLQSNNITRLIIAKVLQAGWGVADTGTYWSAASGEQRNYMWAVGNTPFGIMGSTAAPSELQAYAAMRNLIINEINDTITVAINLLKGFSHVSHRGRLDGVLNNLDLHTYHARTNLMLFRIDRCLGALGVRNFKIAMRYARMLSFDVDALFNLSQRLNRELSVEMQCHTTVAVSWMRYPLFLGGGALLVVAALVWQQRSSRSKKRDW